MADSLHNAGMVRADAALIGGTGIGSRLLALGGENYSVLTEHGLVRFRLIDHEGCRIAVLQRHSAGHKVPPHSVNYKGMAQALKMIGAKACVASAAVGCLRTEWPLGEVVICTDMIDLTFRNITMFEKQVYHQEIASPFPLATELNLAARQLSPAFQPKATYAGLNGPRYESPAEIKMLATLGADIVGMTATTEAICMKEAGIPYGCLTIVTNIAEGLSEDPIEHGAVTDVMLKGGPLAVQIMLSAAKSASS